MVIKLQEQRFAICLNVFGGLIGEYDCLDLHDYTYALFLDLY